MYLQITSIFPPHNPAQSNFRSAPSVNDNFLPAETVDFSDLLEVQSNIGDIDEMLDTLKNSLEQHSMENFLAN